MNTCALCDNQIPKTHRYCKDHRSIDLICYQCGKDFTLVRYEYDRRPTKNYHCSRPCYLAYMKTDEYKQERREQSAGYWDSDEYREKVIAARAETYKTPEEKARRSRVSRALWDDPDFRKRHKESMDRVHASPEYRAKHSANTKERWQDPEYRKKVLDALPRGPDNHSWKGGIGNLPYGPDFTEKLKYEVKERDGFECKLCPSTEDLCVHHIDYDKFNNEMHNLVTLCRSCHSKTNNDRSYWHILFMPLVDNISLTWYNVYRERGEEVLGASVMGASFCYAQAQRHRI